MRVKSCLCCRPALLDTGIVAAWTMIVLMSRCYSTCGQTRSMRRNMWSARLTALQCRCTRCPTLHVQQVQRTWIYLDSHSTFADLLRICSHPVETRVHIGGRRRRATYQNMMPTHTAQNTPPPACLIRRVAGPRRWIYQRQARLHATVRRWVDSFTVSEHRERPCRGQDPHQGDDRAVQLTAEYMLRRSRRTSTISRRS